MAEVKERHHFEVLKEVIGKCKGQGFALDMGGTFFKVVYISKLQLEENEMNRTSKLHMETFTYNELDKALDFIKENVHMKPDAKVYGTGLYLPRWKSRIEENLGLGIEPLKETGCSVNAFQYMLHNNPRRKILHKISDTIVQVSRKENEHLLKKRMQTFTAEGKERKNFNFVDSWDSWFLEDSENLDEPFSCDKDIYPCLLVRCDSAFGIISVHKDGSFQEKTFHSIGGKTWNNVGQYMTGGKHYQEFMELTQNGDHRAVDFCQSDADNVRDSEMMNGVQLQIRDRPIFSLGKLVDVPAEHIEINDILASILHMIVNNLVQHCHNTARLTKEGSKQVKHIFFCGGFVNQPHVRQLLYEGWKCLDCHRFAQGETKEPIHCHFLEGGQHYVALGALLPSHKNYHESVDSSVQSLLEHFESFHCIYFSIFIACCIYLYAPY